MILHSGDDDWNWLLRWWITENMLVHLRPQGSEKMPGPVSGSSAEDDDFRSIDMNSAYQEPSEIRSPMPQLIRKADLCAPQL